MLHHPPPLPDFRRSLRGRCAAQPPSRPSRASTGIRSRSASRRAIRLRMASCSGRASRPIPLPAEACRRARWKSAGKSLPTQPSATIVQRGTETGSRRVGAFGPRRGRRARARPRVFLPLSRRRRDEPGRQDANGSGGGWRGAPAFRLRLVPAVRAGLVLGVSPHGAGRPRSRHPPRRLHLRVLVGPQPRAQARRPRSRRRWRSTATATRSTRATRT